MNKNGLGYVSLFSSAGVGCYGFSLEGFDCIASSELIQRRLDIQKANKVCSLEDGYVGGDFTLPETRDRVLSAIEKWKTTYSKNEVDVVIATPPCQGISVANHKKSDELKRNSLVVESIKLIDKITPRYFVLENVRGFLNTICTDIDGIDKKIIDAILLNLAGHYNIAYRVMNFKNHGNNSSRTRTVVVGVRKDIEDVTPYELFPAEKEPRTLRELIGSLRPLTTMGEIDTEDIYHGFRSYDTRMVDWIKDIKEGQSAFDNINPKTRPHKVIDGVMIANVNKNGDKYSRCYWDKVAPCIHTRNDILASQATIHPVDNRVFSIRELMKFMTVPESFKWTDDDINTLNLATLEEKKAHLKKNEINIRQSLGEAVPTSIFQAIADNIKKVETRTAVSVSQIKKIIERDSLSEIGNLFNYIDLKRPDFTTATKVAELANAKRLDDAAFYTRQELCFNLVSDLPDFKTKKIVKILEPSVGVGNFLPVLFEKYRHIELVKLDLVDINDDSIKTLKKLVKLLRIPKNFEIRFINDDFLKRDFRIKYDVVVGNPPFGSISAEQHRNYQDSDLGSTISTRNLFALFIEKALKIADYVALFSPKSLLGAPEFDELRMILANKSILKISDYGEKGFRGVKIETISIQVSNKLGNNKTIVDSYILNMYAIQAQSYIIDEDFPTWIIYRNSFFDNMTNDLNLNLFKVYRDRSLTSKNMLSKGKVRVIKSRNITYEGIKDLPADQYVSDRDASAIANQYYDRDSVIVAPNLSYYPRAVMLPKKTIVDGSAAVLLPINDSVIIAAETLKFFSSKEYFLFYRIARNYATRSLNIDRNSVFYWGLPKDDVTHQYSVFDNSIPRSSFLFMNQAQLLEAS
jgi:DNA (cytosine-5)-methyltransferase 1